MTEHIDPFVYHGVMFDRIPEKAGQAIGDCMFCGKEGHFYANVQNGLWDCKHCGMSGNIPTFLQQVVKHHRESTTPADYKRVQKIRQGVAASADYARHDFAWTGSRWLFPTRSHTGHVQDLRLFDERTRRIGGTKGCKTGLWGIERLVSPENAASRVWICEGEWDGVALESLFRRLGIKDVVVAVPGANVFKREWIQYFAERHVIVAYDADKSGDEGMLKVRSLLNGRVKSLKFIRWPLNLTEGYDVSDVIRDTGKRAAHWLEDALAVAPRTEALPDTGRAAGRKGRAKKRHVRASYEDVVRAYSRWLDLTEDALMCLRTIMAVVFSNRMSGDPLWMYVVAPPGSGKTALLNPLRSCEDHCVFRSSLTTHALVSGYQGNSDPSLIPKLAGKTLVLKDMTEILSAPLAMQEEVFSTLRGAYDGHVERSYGNGKYCNYDVSFSMLAGVTVAIHGHSRAQMGERMLKFQLVPHGKLDHESTIRAALQNTGREEAMDLELAEVTKLFLGKEWDVDKIVKAVPDWAYDRIVAIAQIIAKLRSEVERDFRGDTVKYRPQEEVATRLAKQLLKMGMLLTLTSPKGDYQFGEEEFRIVERVAFDTAIGWNLDVVQAMMSVNGGVEVSRNDIVAVSQLPSGNVARRLEDMCISRLIERSTIPGASRNQPRVFYSVSPRLRELWQRSGINGHHVDRVATARKGQRAIFMRKPKRKKKEPTK